MPFGVLKKRGVYLKLVLLMGCVFVCGENVDLSDGFCLRVCWLWELIGCLWGSSFGWGGLIWFK